MRKLLLGFAPFLGALLFLCLTGVSTRADIIYLPTETAPPGGVGHRPESILSIQSPKNGSLASGGVRSVLTTNKKGNTVRQDSIFGDAKQGEHTKTLSFSEAGISSAGALRIFMDTEDADNSLLLKELVLTAYMSDGTTIDFSLAAPINFTNELNGQGKGDRVFALDSAQAAILQAAFARDPNLRLGLFATTLGDEGSFTNFKLGEGAAPVPEPATMLLLGTGIAGVAAKVRKRRKSPEDQS